jgi:photosynthetic reaction center H subunit
LADGIGPAAWADRAKRPDLDMEGHPRIVPLGNAIGYSVAREDSDLSGWPVIGADGAVAGHVNALWIDTADRLVRYLQLQSEGGPLLAPMMMAKVDRRGRRIVIDALNAGQFAGVPRLEANDQITLYEEERVQAYFGGGYLYANAARQEPFL